MWSALDYAPVLPMDHDPLGIASMARNTNEEPVDAHGSRCTRESIHAGVDVRESTHLSERGPLASAGPRRHCKGSRMRGNKLATS